MRTLEDIRKVLQAHRHELRSQYRVTTLGIFGSYVRAEQKPTSDIDLLVEFEEPVSLLWIVKVENHLSDLLGIKVDLIPKPDLRPELRDRILREAVPL